MFNLGKYGEWHEVRFVEDWAKADISGEWSIALVDHSPGKRRIEEIKRLKDTTDYIIVHDTEPAEYYGYEKIWDLFKYRFDYTQVIPNTTVLSNKHDLKGLL